MQYWFPVLKLQSKVGNTLPIRNIPVGTTIHCIEMSQVKVHKFARSAGASAVLLAKEGAYAQVRLRSGEVRKISVNCVQLSVKLVTKNKAEKNR